MRQYEAMIIGIGPTVFALTAVAFQYPRVTVQVVFTPLARRAFIA